MKFKHLTPEEKEKITSTVAYRVAKEMDVAPGTISRWRRKLEQQEEPVKPVIRVKHEFTNRSYRALVDNGLI